MKVAIVVQRYGADVNGGAELHARYIAEHLKRHVEVEVLTTCARDYITWRNELPEGVESVHGVPVRRFPVARERDPREFGRHSERVFTAAHSLNDELAWLDAEGPASPALVAYIRQQAAAFDFFIFFSFRYYHAFHGARAVADKAILVPTAERDEALGLGLFAPVFRGVRAIMYNSFEERALIQQVSGNHAVPGVVVGVGSEVPSRTDPERFRQRHGMYDRFAVYVGRIDENKGCAELFTFFQTYARMEPDGLSLVLIGHPVIPIPDHPRIRHLGFVSDEDKFDAIAAADLLVMPSYFESLSMVALEAWALGKPVLANGRCDVLKGQSIRSNAGLYYTGIEEFVEALRTLGDQRGLAAALGANGREYFRRHYAWPVIERSYTDMLDRLTRDAGAARPGMEPWPGWWARRRRTLPPAREVVQQLPAGPVLKTERDRGRPSRPRPQSRGTDRRGPERRGPSSPRDRQPKAAVPPAREASADRTRPKPANPAPAHRDRPRPDGRPPQRGGRRRRPGPGGRRP
ncbi:MAG: glycosyltransferase [Vicinamibacterales bacterium]|nr:glycosyltransferase [Vicinamibacterales bacterium]